MLPPHRPFREKPIDSVDPPVAARLARPQPNSREASARIPPERLPLKPKLKVVGGSNCEATDENAGGRAGAQ